MSEKDLKEIENQVKKLSKAELQEIAMKMLIARHKTLARVKKHNEKKKNKGEN